MTDPIRTVRVQLPGRDYDITIGADLLRRGEPALTPAPEAQVHVVTNETVAPLYLDRLCERWPDKDVPSVVLPDGEAHKTLDSVRTVIDALVAAGHGRDVTVVALGGGVVGDIAGFAAASYMRGVRFVQVPTTLLAQVDASVGGKTGVNHPRGKNLIGAFHQPAAVLCDTATLSTLPEREYRAGLAEVVKYGMLGDREFFEWLESNVESLLRQESVVLAETIGRCCENKAAIVAEDEREAGRRALLNLGHTFGHAIETVTGYRRYLHGEAVGIGLALAARLSGDQGRLADADAERCIALLTALGLETDVPGDLSVGELLAAMRLDKKARAGAMRLILMTAIGEAEIVADVGEEPVSRVLAEAGAAG